MRDLIRPMPYVVADAPTEPGPASQLFYDLDVHTPGGVKPLLHVQPHSHRPPNEIDTQPVAIGTCGWAWAMQRTVQITMNEQAAYGPCPEGIAGVTDEGSRLLVIVAAMTADQRAQLRSLLNG